MNPVRFGAGQIDPGDFGARRESRDVLSYRAAPDALSKIVRDSCSDGFERELAALDFAIEANDMEPIAGRYRLSAD